MARCGGDKLMCSVLTHPVVPIALSTVFPPDTLPPTVLLVGAACSVIPDIDVIGRKFGIRSNHMLGHRGLTHLMAFAAVLGAIPTCTLFRSSHPDPWVLFLFLFVSTLSHALLDMLTNGGRRGVLIIRSECRWVWLPSAGVCILGIMVRRYG